MDCLNNLIGIKGTCGGDTTPDSGHFINDWLDGVTIENLDAAITGEKDSGYEEISRIITQAGDMTAAMFRTSLQPRFNGSSIIENTNVGKWRKNLEAQTAQSTYLVGVQLKISQYKYFELFLSQLRLHMQGTAAVTVEVWDLTSGIQLDTFAVSAVADTPTALDIFKKYKTDGQKLNLFIGYDGANATYKSDLFTNTNCCGGSEWLDHRYITFKGAKILKSATKIDQNIESQQGSSGLSFTYSLNCTMEPFICSIKDQLAIPIMFKSGELVMQKLRFSKRLNSIVTLHNDDHEQLQTFYATKFTELMANVLQNAVLRDGVCWECDRLVAIKTDVG